MVVRSVSWAVFASWGVGPGRGRSRDWKNVGQPFHNSNVPIDAGQEWFLYYIPNRFVETSQCTGYSRLTEYASPLAANTLLMCSLDSGTESFLHERSRKKAPLDIPIVSGSLIHVKFPSIAVDQCPFQQSPRVDFKMDQGAMSKSSVLEFTWSAYRWAVHKSMQILLGIPTIEHERGYAHQAIWTPQDVNQL